jgi:hypothetical protein
MEYTTQIDFDNGDTMWVPDTVSQIENQLAGATSPHIPLITVIDKHGTDVHINANHIRAFRPVGGARKLVAASSAVWSGLLNADR